MSKFLTLLKECGLRETSGPKGSKHIITTVLSSEIRILQKDVSSSWAWQYDGSMPWPFVRMTDGGPASFRPRHLQLKTIVGSINAQPCGFQGTSPGSHRDEYISPNVPGIPLKYTLPRISDSTATSITTGHLQVAGELISERIGVHLTEFHVTLPVIKPGVHYQASPGITKRK